MSCRICPAYGMKVFKDVLFNALFSIDFRREAF